MELSNKHRKIVDNLIEMKDVVVPILGDDIFHITVPGGDRISMHRYLLDCFIDEYGDPGLSPDDRDMIVRGGYYGLSKLERLFPSDFETDYRRYIRDARRAGRLVMDDTVRLFIEAFAFPLVITTTAFDIIESSVASPRYATRSYSPGGDNSLLLSPAAPTVYHIFGTIADGAQWVYDEDKLLEFLHALHNADTTSRALRRYIDSRNCRLMAIGCNLPDWLFRFLWYPIKNPGRGFWINSREISASFNDFLDNIKFYTASEVSDILAAAVDALSETGSDRSADEAVPMTFDAFLSYASEDKALAQRVFDILTRQGYRIWFDKEGSGKIEVGSNYMKKIVAGMEASRHYLPLITENFIAKACNPDSNLKKEIDIARDVLKADPSKAERFSMPVIADGRTFNDQPINNAFVEGMTMFVLPASLFRNINMYTMSPDDTTLDFTL